MAEEENLPKRTRKEKIAYNAPGRQWHTHAGAEGVPDKGLFTSIRGLRDVEVPNDPTASNGPVITIKSKDQS